MSRPEWAVPYITRREGEEPQPASMLHIRWNRAGRPTGICYQHETTLDRDVRSVLWARCSQSRSASNGHPVGKPLFAEMHPSRQREMMTALRCQVCGRPASRNALGWLFLEMADAERDVEGIRTSQPPVCVEHAVKGIETCRHLGDRGYVLLRARIPRLYGVIGTVFRVGDAGLEPLPPLTGPNGEDMPIPYTERKVMRWLWATQLVRELHGVTRVEIDQEQAQAESESTARRSMHARGLR